MYEKRLERKSNLEKVLGELIFHILTIIFEHVKRITRVILWVPLVEQELLISSRVCSVLFTPKTQNAGVHPYKGISPSIFQIRKSPAPFPDVSKSKKSAEVQIKTDDITELV